MKYILSGPHDGAQEYHILERTDKTGVYHYFGQTRYVGDAKRVVGLLNLSVEAEGHEQAASEAV